MPARHPIKTLPSREYLRECFDYDPATGVLTWKYRPRKHFIDQHAWAKWNTRYARTFAGRYHKGYRAVRLDGTNYFAHRLILKWITGEEPSASPDHRNGNQRDNRWENLRPATTIQQSWNARPKTNPYGFRGVYQLPSGRYAARIRDHGRRCYLGAFDTAREANAAYEAAARKLHGEFFRV